MTSKQVNNLHKYDIHYSPMLESLLVLNQNLDKTNKGRCIKILKQGNLLMLDKIKRTQAGTTINGNLK